MINLIVNGNSYSYPQPGDKANTGWGSQGTNWASAVTAALTSLGLGGTLTPTPNAVVDISSTTKGILIPRLTTTQRNAITSPATSLLIFNTTLGVFQYYTGSAWITVGAKIPDNVQFDGTLLVNGNINTNGGVTAVGAVSGASLNITGNATVDGVIYADDNTTANTPVISFIGDANTGIGRSAADTLDFITNGNSRFRIEPTGQIKAVYESQVGNDYNIQLNNGYLCRAWVNFDGKATQKTGTYTISGTTITVSITSHGLSTGNFAQLDFASGDGVDGRYQVTVINANNYTVTNSVSGSTGGIVTQDAMIRASGNVSSITDNNIGDYTVNFTTDMPDTNYNFVFGAQDVGQYQRPTISGNYLTNPTTSTLRLNVDRGDNITADILTINVAVFR